MTISLLLIHSRILPARYLVLLNGVCGMMASHRSNINNEICRFSILVLSFVDWRSSTASPLRGGIVASLGISI